jgi:flagellar biosynthesis component FlhA
MTGTLDGSIPVVVELGDSLNALTDAPESQGLKQRLTSDLNALLEQLGLRGEPAVEVRRVNSRRAVRVRAHGTVQPYAPELMKRAWQAVAPADVRNAPDTTETAGEASFPDAWFKAFVAGVNSSGDASRRDLVFEYLARLALEVIRERPSCLVGAAQVAAYREHGLEQSPHLASSVAPDALSLVLPAMLDGGLSVTNHPLVLQAVADNSSAEDAIEAAFAQLRAHRLEIHVHPEYFQTIFPGETLSEPTSVYAERFDPSLQEQFRTMEDGLFYEFGIHLPDLFWAPSTDVPQGMIAVKINDCLRPAALGLPAGELLVNDTVERLGLLVSSVPGRPATHPVSGSECAIVAEQHKEFLEQAGLTTWTLPQFAMLVLSAEIRQDTARLFTMEDAECQLAQMEQAFPELVHAVVERFSLGDIARVLRGLLREGISIRDTRTILEKMLQYDWILTDPLQFIIFDDRHLLREGTPAERTNHWTNYHEFVRSGLKNYITHKYSRGQGTLIVYLIDPALETRLQADAVGALNEAEREALWDALWAESAIPTSTTPVLLTATGVRAPLRELIASEFPHLPVVAYTELQADINIQPIVRISIDSKSLSQK